MTTKTTLFVCGTIAATVLAGCVGSDRQAASGDPFAAALYTGAPQPDRADHFAYLRAPEQTSANGAPFEVVSYAGIEGARRAHLRYTEEDAEKLDGRCERYVEASATESLIDVANLCDVPLEMLVDYNPDVKNVSYASPGAVLEIPGGTISPRGTFAMKDALADLYTVEEGDTLEKIAYKLNVSESSIAKLNPDVYLSDLAPGQALRRPAVSAATTTAQNYYAPAAPPAAWQGYSGGQGIGSSQAGSAIGTKLAPYTLTPAKAYARPRGLYPEASIYVDKEFVRRGDSVRVTVPNLDAGEEVRIYGGKRTITRRAGSDGTASADVEISEGASIGGLIFEAKPSKSGGTRYSKRVGVVTLEKTLPVDEETKADEDEEDAD